MLVAVHHKTDDSTAAQNLFGGNYRLKRDTLHTLE